MKNSRIHILEALAKYKYLTTIQMERLGIMRSRKYIGDELKGMRLSSTPLVECLTFGVVPNRGKLPYFYHLTKYGKQYLVEALKYEEGEVRIPIGITSPFNYDYFHRTYTIDFHISLQQWADKNEVEVVFFDTYFDKTGNNRKNANLKTKTKVSLSKEKFFIPDGVFMLELSDGERELYCLEVHNGKNTKKLMGQLTNHLYLLTSGRLSIKYKYQWAHRILVVFENESIMRAALSRCANMPLFQYTHEHFLFKTLDSILKEDFFHGWLSLHGEITTLY